MNRKQTKHSHTIKQELKKAQNGTTRAKFTANMLRPQKSTGQQESVYLRVNFKERCVSIISNALVHVQCKAD